MIGNESEQDNHQNIAQGQETIPHIVDEEVFTTEKKSLFDNGTFVIALIVFSLCIVIITASVSFLAMLFGAIGVLVSIASQMFINNEEFNFIPHCNKLCSIENENYAYVAVRAVLGMIYGTGCYLFVYSLLEPNWTHIIVLSLFGSFVFDRLLFRKNK